MARVAVLIASTIITAACTSKDELAPFASDGCSLFPDNSILTEADWCSCCVEHDIAYWRGGTYDEREVADRRLAECVLEKTGDNQLADLMFEGVRLGGSPYFYSWYRWGYGWSFDRKYQALTSDEISIADGMLDQHTQSELLYCPN